VVLFTGVSFRGFWTLLLGINDGVQAMTGWAPGLVSDDLKTGDLIKGE